MAGGVLCSGDGLGVLPRYMVADCVGLTYPDGPLSSDASQDALRAERHGRQAAAQIWMASSDAWQ